MSSPVLREPRLDEAGCLEVPDFVPADRLDAINRELDVVFQAPSFNGPFFCTIHDRHVRSVTSPALLTSINVLELAVDAAETMAKFNPAFDPAEYYVMNIAVYSEMGNSKPLEWHTDNNADMWSAQIYLRGGSEESGRFKYMRGTHRRNFRVEHFLPADRVAELSETIADLDCRPGSLVIFHPNGFHFRTSCADERRVIRIEFLKRTAEYRLLKPFFPSHCLSERVVEHVRLFSNYDPRKDYTWKDAVGARPSSHAPLAQRILGTYAKASMIARRLWAR